MSLHLKRIWTLGTFLVMLLANQVWAQSTFYGNGSSLFVGESAVIFVDGDVHNDNQAVIDNNGAIKLVGNWINNAGNLNFVAQRPGYVHLIGGQQQILGSDVTRFNNLMLEGTSFKSLLIDAEIEDTLDLTSIRFETNEFRLRMLSTNLGIVRRTGGFYSLLGGYVSSNLNGAFSRPVLSNGDYFFPVGSPIGIERYRPILMRPNANNTRFDIRFANVDPDTEVSPGTLNSNTSEINQLFYHQIDRTEGTAAADLRIHYLEGPDGDWSHIARHDGNEWESILGEVSGNNSGFDYLEAQLQNEYSPFVLSNSTIDDTVEIICFGDGLDTLYGRSSFGTDPFTYRWFSQSGYPLTQLASDTAATIDWSNHPGGNDIIFFEATNECGVDTIFLRVFVKSCVELCNNGIDDDEDGFTDGEDDECLNIYAVNDINAVTQGNSTDGQVLTNDILQGDGAEFGNVTLVNDVLEGQLTLNLDGTYTYDAPADFEGTEIFTYSVCLAFPNSNICDTAQVVIEVIPSINGPENDRPIALADFITMFENDTLTSSVTGNDYDFENDPFQAALLPGSNTANGQLTLNPSGTYTYIPNPEFIGDDSFSYVICEIATPTNCDTTFVVITVLPDANPEGNHPPLAGDDFFVTNVNNDITFTVTSNDGDVDNDPLTYTLTSDLPSNGQVTYNSNTNSFTYDPDPNYVGDDNFTYSVCDNQNPQLCDTATVYISIVSDIEICDDGIDNNNDGLTDCEDPVCASTDAGCAGVVISEVQICEGLVELTNISTQTIDIANWNICATGFQYSSIANGDVSIVSGNTLLEPGDIIAIQWNAIDPNDGEIGLYANGNGFGNADNIRDYVQYNSTNNNRAALAVSAGVWSSVNDAVEAATGPNCLSFGLNNTNGNDGTGTDVNDFCLMAATIGAPNADCYEADILALNDINVTTEDEPVSGNVVVNDNIDAPSGFVTRLIDIPNNGAVTLNEDGTYTYDPAPGFIGQDTFVYEVCDTPARLFCDSAIVVIEVLPIIDDTTIDNAPVALLDVFHGFTATPIVGSVLGNDFDIDGDVIDLVELITTTSPNGNIAMDGNGVITYQSNPGFVGQEVFTYRICSGTPQQCDTADIYIDVIEDPTPGANDAPIAGDDAVITTINTEVTGSLASNDYDPNGHLLIYTTQIVSGPAKGDATITNNGGDFSYFPANDSIGSDQFTYEVCDNQFPPLCDTATVYVTIQGISEVCINGTDDDLDGLLDCEDPDCIGSGFCPENDSTLCTDGIDNDGDGDIDCDDSDCQALGSPICTEDDPILCADGIDNDGDGAIDCADPDCQALGSTVCPENDSTLCNDGIDNDGDGLLDCADDDCVKPLNFDVVGGGEFCEGQEAGRTVGLNGSETTVRYRLYRNGVQVGAPVLGTGSAFDFPIQSVDGVYKITGAPLASGCEVEMLDSATIIGYSTPVINSVQVTTPNNCPDNNNGAIAVDADADGAALEYRLETTAGVVVIDYQANSVFTGVSPGNYFVKVRTAMGQCETINADSTVVNNPPCNEICDNGIDDDQDGFADCDDAQCRPQILFVQPQDATTCIPGTDGGACIFGNFTTDKQYNVLAQGVNGTSDQFYSNLTPTQPGQLCVGSLSAGDYVFYVFAVQGFCQSPPFGVVTIDQPDGPQINFVNEVDPDSCPDKDNGQVIVFADGNNLSYRLFGPDTDVGNFQSSSTFTGLIEGNYTLRVRDNNTQCFTDWGNPITLIGPDTCLEDCYAAGDEDGDGLPDCQDPICKPTQFTVVGGGEACSGDDNVRIGLTGQESGVLYELLNENDSTVCAFTGLTDEGAFDFPCPIRQTGQYRVIATTDWGCIEPQLGQVNAVIVPGPENTFIDGQSLICPNEAATLNAQFGQGQSTITSVSWFLDNVFTGSSSPNNPSFSTVEPGEYFVVIGDASGCFDTSQIFLLNEGTPAQCIEDCSTANDDDGNGLGGCDDTLNCRPVIDTFIIEQPECPITDHGASIVILASGGGQNGSLLYSIDGGANFQSANSFGDDVLAPGQTINIVVQNTSGGCIVTVPAFTLDTPNCPEICNDGIDNDGDGLTDNRDTVDCIPVIDTVFVVEPTCPDLNNGSIEIIASGGTGVGGFIEYSINNGLTWQDNNIFANLEPGTYNVEVRNTEGRWETEYDFNPVIFTVTSCVEICDNGIDDDGDGVIDGDDAECPNIFAVGDINNILKGDTASGDVVTNDITFGGTTPGTVTLIDDVLNGTLTLNPDGSYEYIPDTSFVGKDIFTYEVCLAAPNQAICDTAEVVIAVREKVDPDGNNAVVAMNDYFVMPENDTLAGVTVFGNDIDPEGDQIFLVTQAPVSPPQNGTLVLLSAANGTFRYIPNPNFTGEDRFTYRVCDVNGLCDIADVVITIIPNQDSLGNQAPFATDDAIATDINVPVAGDVSTNDIDYNEGDIVTFQVTTVPENGTVTLDTLTGEYVYTPDPNFIGDDQFSYVICDDGNPRLCDMATVYITVNGLPEVCDDGIDNDGDGLQDCEDDADCANAACCTPYKVKDVDVRQENDGIYLDWRP